MMLFTLDLMGDATICNLRDITIGTISKEIYLKIKFATIGKYCLLGGGGPSHCALCVNSP